MGATPIYSEFDTTPTNAAGDIKAKILTQSDWASLTGTGLTTAVKATTTRGAQMVVDFNDAAGGSSVRLPLGIYRTHDGTTAVDKLVRYLNARSAGGATTDPWHVCVSASKEHLWVSLEGPRTGEPNGGSNYRSVFYIGDLLPYFAGDTVATVVMIGHPTTGSFAGSQPAVVSRNAANTASWVLANLATLGFLAVTGSSSTLGTQTPNLNPQAAADGNAYLWPFVVVEVSAGLRGRLAYTFCGGGSASGAAGPDPIVAPGQKFTYAGATYIATIGPNGSNAYSAFGAGSAGGGNTYPVVCVPSP